MSLYRIDGRPLAITGHFAHFEGKDVIDIAPCRGKDVNECNVRAEELREEGRKHSGYCFA